MKTAIGIMLLAITISVFSVVCAWIGYKYAQQKEKQYKRKRTTVYKKVDPSKVWHRSPEGIWQN